MSQPNLKELGARLQQQRETRNFSLKEIENATSIRISYLKAIEEGEISKLISPVYAQGFIKQYAAFLGFDEQLLKEYRSGFITADKQEFAYGIGTLEMRGHHGATLRWMPSLIYLGMTAGVIAAAWYFARYMGLL